MDSANKLLVGVDEAGYGPNLGPLVVAAVTLEVPSSISSRDLWPRVVPAVSRLPATSPDAVIVDDSKKVFNSGQGLKQLEQVALPLLAMAGDLPRSLRELWRCFCLTDPSDIDDDPCYTAQDLRLPRCLNEHELEDARRRLAAAFARAGFGRAGVVCQIIMPRRFNQLLRFVDSKSSALFQVNAELLRRVWDSAQVHQIEVTLDKHGGRNFYGNLLQQEFYETLVLAGREGAACSDYSVYLRGRSLRARFMPRADGKHLLVAAASMIAKYLRELWMVLFNEFWIRQVASLEPTAGYPGDARRFWNQIEPTALQMGLPRESLWRER